MKKRILLIAIQQSSFVKKDYDILSSAYDVEYLNVKFIFNLIKLYSIIKNFDLIYLWFASLQFIPSVIIAKLLNKKIVVVAGGYDVANVEEIKYGSFYSSWKGLLVRFILNSAVNIIAVSQSNQNEIIKNARINPAKIKMIYHGFQQVQEFNYQKKTNSLLTVGFIDRESFYRKGIDRFLNLANEMQNIDFHLIGRYDDFIKNIKVPNNVKLHGFLTKEKLIEILETAKVYIQLSRHEGFGCSVAEAMQLGCVPVVSNVYALPEVVGDKDIIIDNPNNLDYIEEKIIDIFNNFDERQFNDCAKRINTIFNFEKRKNSLLELVHEIFED